MFCSKDHQTSSLFWGANLGFNFLNSKIFIQISKEPSCFRVIINNYVLEWQCFIQLREIIG